MRIESERERRALADDLARIIGAAVFRLQPCMSGDIWDRLGPLRKRACTDAADGVLAELAALRQPTAEPDTAGREAGAAEMQRRCEQVCEAISTDYANRIGTTSERMGIDGECSLAVARAEDVIRSLPLHPEGSERTMGGDDAA